MKEGIEIDCCLCVLGLWSVVMDVEKAQAVVE